jgi:anaerobic magnesium-protoporphyrin IX monomethyl ester cyclase
MGILFLIPPSELNRNKMPVDRVYGCNYGFDYKPAIHLLLLATLAKRLGREVEFLDCPAQGYTLKKFRNYLARNSSIETAVFFTVWLSAEGDKEAAEIISGLTKKVKIIFTGPYPTWKPDMFLKHQDCFVIRGEPENALSEFIKLHGSDNGITGIKNLSYVNERGIVHNGLAGLADIDTLPIPDRRLLKAGYLLNRIDVYPATIMGVSRGCPYSCSYCAPNAMDQAIELEYLRHNLKKPPLRLKSVANVIMEFKEIASLGYRGIEICDNQFVWDKARMIAICEGIRHLNLKWICCARADSLKDRNMLEAMREAGCVLIYIGTESFCQQILDEINKGIKVEDMYRAVALVKECGIKPEVSVLLGASALETEETIRHSIQKAKELSTGFVHYSIACPLPNTLLYRISKEKGWMKTGEFIPVDNRRNALLDLPGVKGERLEGIIKQCYAEQYLSPRFIARQMLNINFFRQLNLKIRSLAALIKYSYGKR